MIPDTVSHHVTFLIPMDVLAGTVDVQGVFYTGDSIEE